VLACFFLLRSRLIQTNADDEVRTLWPRDPAADEDEATSRWLAKNDSLDPDVQQHLW
jgi:hypothetical protein